MYRIIAKNLKQLRSNDLKWRQIASVLFLATLLAISAGCNSNGSNPLSPVPAAPVPGGGGGDPQPLPSSRAIIQSPSCGSRLTNTTTFTWNSATDVDYYTLEFHGSDDETDLLTRYTPGRSTSQPVAVSQIDKRPVLWVKLTTHHLDRTVSEPYWCEFWYPTEDVGWILDHLEYTAMERWYHGSGGHRVIYENLNVARTTRQFTAEPINSVWETGHYRVESTLRIDELPDHIAEGGQGALRASATANISSAGLGFSRGAGLGINVSGSTDSTGEPNAENRAVTLNVSVGPKTTGPTERIAFETEAGLNSINDSRLKIRVVAVYRRTEG